MYAHYMPLFYKGIKYRSKTKGYYIDFFFIKIFITFKLIYFK